jgi:hypothetical protein
MEQGDDDKVRSGQSLPCLLRRLKDEEFVA